MRSNLSFGANWACIVVFLASLLLIDAGSRSASAAEQEAGDNRPATASRLSLATVFQGPDTSQATLRLAANVEKPRIVSINKASARADERITLEITGVPASAYSVDISVIIGGYPLPPEPGSGLGLLIARVPPELTEAIEKPDIFVRFTPSLESKFAPISIKYEGPFSIVKSTPWQKLQILFVTLSSSQRDALIGFAIAVFFGSSTYYYYRARRRRLTKNVLGITTQATIPDATTEAEGKEPDPPFTLKPLSVPDSLVTVVAEGDCVAFAGAGLSAQAGLPIWQDLLASVIEGLRETEVIQSDFAARLVRLLNNGEVEDAADGLTTALGVETNLALSLIEKTLQKQNPEPSDAHSQLAQLPLAALLTTNFDDLLERAFSEREPAVFTPSQAAAGLDAFSQGKLFLLKLSGVLSDPGSVIFSPKQYTDKLRESPVFRDLLDRIVLSRSLFFVGVSLDGIEEFFQGTSVSPSRGAKHFALVAAKDDSWQVKAPTFENRYGVTLVPFAHADRGEAVGLFLTELRKRAEEQRAQFEASAQPSDGPSFLNRVELFNVGPFEHLSLELDEKWNLFLGDNGVGKSTILKAIAVGLVGKAAQPWAGRIVKSGKETATIVLHTNTKKAYKTTITRRLSDGTVEVETGQLTAMAAESWLALGFPALRTVTWERRASEPSLGIRRPMAGDLLPLITDEADPRLDGLKHQIVKLKRKGSAGGDRHDINYEGLLQDLISIFAKVLEDMTIEIADPVDEETDEITVKTADGLVPFESLSQGTTSLIAWAGVLLQRLYETAGPDDKNKQRERYALVMIDELDAHMHPQWQNNIVKRLTRVFPNVQFLSATHSPLIVRGMEMDCIKRFKRNADSGKVDIVEVADEMTMGRADQVLASELFDTTGFDAITEDTIKDYKSLLAMEELSDSDRKELLKLEKKLQFRIPVPDTTPRDRRAREVFTKLLEVQMLQLQERGSEEQEIRTAREMAHQDLLIKAKELLDEIEGKIEVSK